MRSASMNAETANLVLGLSVSSRLPRRAEEWLLEGYDSPSLRMLAGLTEKDIDQAVPLFKKAVMELGWPLPDRLEAVKSLSRQVARQILSGEVQPYEGSKRIWELTLKAGGDPP